MPQHSHTGRRTRQCDCLCLLLAVVRGDGGGGPLPGCWQRANARRRGMNMNGRTARRHRAAPRGKADGRQRLPLNVQGCARLRRCKYNDAGRSADAPAAAR